MGNRILNHCSKKNILCGIRVTREILLFRKVITGMETTYPRN